MYKMSSFIDSHLHFLGLGYIKTLVNLDNNTSIHEVIQTLKSALNQDILIARGWNQEQLVEKRMLTKFDLDQASFDTPIVAIRVCGHVVSVNSKMLSLMNLESHESGVFTEDDIHLVYQHIHAPSKSDLKRYAKIANQECIANGITKVASDDFSTFNVPYELVIEAMNEAIAEGLIDISITEQVNLPSIDLLSDFIDKGYANKRYLQFQMGPLKLLADGSLGGRTAALFEAYTDDPSTQGILNFSDDELFKLISLADSNNIDCAIHVIGDRAASQVLTAYEKTIKLSRRQHKHTLIHAQIVNLEQIQKMSELHVQAIVQPIFLNSDLSMINNRIGDRKNESYLFHTMKERGINVGFSTDAPVEHLNPFENIYTAMTRKSLKNTNLQGLLNENLFTIEESIHAYTTSNLAFVYASSHNDSIIVSENPYETSIESLKQLEILQTMIDGRIVYQK